MTRAPGPRRGRAIYICGTDERTFPDEPPTDGTLACPNIADHTPSPRGYVEWHGWAARMQRTHVTRRCPGCGLYKIWVPRSPKPEKA